MRPFPAELMRMWPISTRITSPRTTILQFSSPSKWQGTLRKATELQAKVGPIGCSQRLALRRFFDFVGEALREATVFEQQSLRASRQPSISPAAPRAALLILPMCCPDLSRYLTRRESGHSGSSAAPGACDH